MNNSFRTSLASFFVIFIIFTSLFTVGCNNSNTGRRQTLKDDFRYFHSDLWRDSKKLFTYKENLAILAVGAGGSGYYRCAEDDRVENHFAGHHTFSRDFNIAAGTIGNPVTHLALASSGYFYGLFADDEQNRKLSRTLLEALTLDYIITTALKTAAQDHGPNGEPLAWPSGHTSSSVTFATVMNEYFGPWVGAPLFALSGLVMYERMETGEHWASDVIFGAAIGFTVGRTVAAKEKPQIVGFNLVPYMDYQTGASGIALFKNF